MRRKKTLDGHDSPALRPARWVSFFITLALIAILGIATSAQGLTAPAGSAGSAGALASPFGEEAVTAGGEGEGENGEEEESEGEECEEDEVGEEGEDDEEAACTGKDPGQGQGQGNPTAPQVCPLSSAKATVFVLSNGDKVRLQVRYATTQPTNAAVDYGLHGGRGSLELGGATKRFANRGVLLLTKSLSGAQTAKVVAARGFTVRIRVRNCRVFVRQLTIKRATPGGATWLQSG
jgi:hypothetical protein